MTPLNRLVRTGQGTRDGLSVAFRSRGHDVHEIGEALSQQFFGAAFHGLAQQHVVHADHGGEQHGKSQRQGSQSPSRKRLREEAAQPDHSTGLERR